MRFVAVMMLVQIFAAVSTPCPDISSGSMFATGSVRVAAEVAAPDKDEDRDDECSPFCTCSCRQVPTPSVAVCEPAAETAMNAPARDVVFEHRDDPETSFQKPIWQPPQA